MVLLGRPLLYNPFRSAALPLFPESIFFLSDYSESLPIGVMNSLEIDSVKRQLTDGTYVIMLTDGVLDALPVGEQDFLLETIIKGTEIRNPKELARHILQQVLNWTGKEPEDDMSVLVAALWKCRK